MPTDIICSFTEAEALLRDRTGRVWRCEWHRACGPSVMRKDGSEAKNQPGPRSAFWPAAEAWNRNGLKVDENGYAVTEG
jgi:hypothetical protein